MDTEKCNLVHSLFSSHKYLGLLLLLLLHACEGCGWPILGILKNMKKQNGRYLENWVFSDCTVKVFYNQQKYSFQGQLIFYIEDSYQVFNWFIYKSDTSIIRMGSGPINLE